MKYILSVPIIDLSSVNVSCMIMLKHNQCWTVDKPQAFFLLALVVNSFRLKRAAKVAMFLQSMLFTKQKYEKQLVLLTRESLLS